MDRRAFMAAAAAGTVLTAWALVARARACGGGALVWCAISPIFTLCLAVGVAVAVGGICALWSTRPGRA